MGKVFDKAKQIGGLVGGATAIYQLAFTVDGKPIREPDKPAAIRVFGLPLFERDPSLDRYWFGVIRRGKSKAAKAALAAREGK